MKYIIYDWLLLFLLFFNWAKHSIHFIGLLEVMAGEGDTFRSQLIDSFCRIR